MKGIEDIQVQIEDVYGCPGSCAGCMLSEAQRNSYVPMIDSETLDKIFLKLDSHIRELSYIQRVQIVFGIADHLLLPLDYLEQVVVKTSDFIKNTKIQNSCNGLFLTTSLIGKSERVVEKISYLTDVSKREGVRLYFTAVLDPKIFDNQKLLDVFTYNLKYAVELTQSVDLTINLSYETINSLTPERLTQYCEDNKIPNIIINWIPTKDNFPHVYKNIASLSAWLLNLLECNKTANFTIAFKESIENLFKYTKAYGDAELSLSELIVKHFYYMSANNLTINPKGKIFINFEAIGDVPHNEGFNIKEVGSIFEERSIMEMLKEKSEYYRGIAIKNISNKHCLSCEYLKECSLSGFHYYNFLVNDVIKNTQSPVFEQERSDTLKNSGCFHLAKNIFASLKNKDH